MAPPSGTLRVGRYFLALLGIFVVLYGLVFWPGHRHTPKLGIDLVGGIRVIYTAVGNTNSGQMDVARQIMEDRVNSNGVTGATVQVQGDKQILILIPNGTGQDVKDIGAAAKLNFRPLVAPAVPVTCGKYAPAGLKKSGATSSASPTATSGTSPSATTSSTSMASTSKAPKSLHERPLDARATSTAKPKTSATSTAKPKTSSTAKASTSPSTSPSASASSSTASQTKAGVCTTKPFAQWQKTNKGVAVPTVDTAFDKLSTTQQSQLVEGTLGKDGALSGGLTNFDCDSALTEPDINTNYYVVCGKNVNSQAPNQEYAFLLGKVVVQGTQITDATAQAPNVSGGGSTEWTVSLELNSTATTNWANYTKANNISGLSSTTASQASASSCTASTVPCADFVAFTLNGEVISSPVTQEAINGGATQISGGWGQDPTGARNLAQQLEYGSLPLTFRLDSQDPVSATLGKSQLHAAFLAGGIGLALVILYSLLYYRGLGLVTIASLVVSGGLTYSLLVILGEHMGFTLDLAGVTGFIVALGITADSFVVFFERIKDEVHEGRSSRTAVPRAWVRARRTILSADIVSFLAAAILYFFASADVQGFAFTLGLSTVLDLVVVFLFTHPIVSLFSRSRAFGSARFTGLNSVRTGPAIADAPEPVRGPRRARGGSSAPAATVVLDAAEAPAGGTAAERAAARRARLRNEQSDGPGEES